MNYASELSQCITEFLRSASEPKLRHCPNCGTLMEYVPATFYFAEEAWHIGLPVCMKCQPESLELIEYRYVA
jgi:DNA-directed RNA polymerase subunit RPC12/RpoP